MKNLLYDYSCVIVLTLSLEILLPPICCIKVMNDTCRTKRDAYATSQLNKNIGYMKEIQGVDLKHERGDDLEKNVIYFTKQKHHISKRSADPVNVDFQPSHDRKSRDYDDIATDLRSQRSNEESADYADAEMTKQETRDTNEEKRNLVRVSRTVNADLDKYTDQDERSSMYDDYELKDVAKRGILGDPEDYEEMMEEFPKEESPLHDMDMTQEEESMDEIENREAQSDVRIKRDQAISENKLDKAKVDSESNNPDKLEESKIIADDPYKHEVPSVDSSKSINEMPVSSDMSKIQASGSNAIPPKRDDLSAEYERHLEEQIQQKIDSIKDEIQHDIEAQRRIKDIQENNARFDELQDHDNEERQSLEDESIQKRENVARRSIREIADSATASLKSDDEKRSLKKEQREKPQRRFIEADESRASKEDQKFVNVKRRSVVDESSAPSKGLLKKKRERVKQMILVNNNHRQARESSQSYALPSAQRNAELVKESSVDRNSNSYLSADDSMVASPFASEGGNKKAEQNSAAAGHLNSLMSLTENSQELSPRLAREYKEAFGGLQSESGSALARFKRIKRVLDSSDANI